MIRDAFVLVAPLFDRCGEPRPRSKSARFATWFAVSAGLVAVAMAGCAGPGPKLFPTQPDRVEQEAGGGTVAYYDIDRDGKVDYAEESGPDGIIVRLRYLDAGTNHTIDLRSIPRDEKRDLVLILDSIPHTVASEAWDNGSLRFFPRPTAVIAPFPVMTDPSLVDFFHLTPGIAIESAYYDGQRETDAYDIYLHAGVAIWHEQVDYALRHIAHGSAYLDQEPWFDHELRRIQDGFGETGKPTYVGYVVGTSAMGALQGRQGHVKSLSRIDRFCHEMFYRARGRVRITLMSDHGHAYYDSRRIALADELESFGYRVGRRLKEPRDLIVPEFAMCSCAAIYAREPVPVAGDVLRIEGVELSAYPAADGSLVVLGRDGEARIHRSGGKYRYVPIDGDPLQMSHVWHGLAVRGELDADGFVDDRALFDATVEHIYPDAVDRLWRAFHEQFRHPPSVLVSVAPGWHCGSEFQSQAVDLQAVHGSLRPASSVGFAATNAGRLPTVVRMRELSTQLERIGVGVLE